MIPALIAAGLWGGTDVLAGISARQSTPLLAALWLHIASLVILAPFVIIISTTISLNAALFGAMAGVAAAIGDVLFGRALSKSAMSVGIPLANVIATALPVLTVVVQGEHLTLLGTVGVVGAMAASGLAVAPSNGRLAVQGASYAVAAGLCFGTMYALLAQVKATDTMVVVFVMRLAGTLALLPGLLHTEQRSFKLLRAGAMTGIASGLASVGANALYIVAMSIDGSRVTASVLAIALSAPAAMVIATLITRERLTSLQGASAVSSILAITIMALQGAF